jgi:hypothetical protein
MKNYIELKNEFNLTELEGILLWEIVKEFSHLNNVCYDYKLTNVEKGIIGSLTKKGLVYDSFKGTDLEIEGSNFFPNEIVLKFCGLQLY